MSRPTIRFLVSLGLLIYASALSSGCPRGFARRRLVVRLACKLGNADRESVRIPQVDVIDASLQAADRALENRDEAVEPRLDVFTAELQRDAARKLHLPRAARRYLHLDRRHAERRETAPEIAVLNRDFLGAARRTHERRQARVVRSGKQFAVGIHQR